MGKPLSITSALSAAAGMAAEGTIQEATKDAYGKVKSLISSRFKEKKNQEGVMALTNYEKKPQVWEAPLKDALTETETEQGHYSREILHKVTLTKGFYMQTTEVTQEQWKAVMGNDPSYFKDCGDDCPVENVSWNDAQEFIKKAESVRRDRHLQTSHRSRMGICGKRKKQRALLFW